MVLPGIQHSAFSIQQSFPFIVFFFWIDPSPGWPRRDLHNTPKRCHGFSTHDPILVRSIVVRPDMSFSRSSSLSYRSPIIWMLLPASSLNLPPDMPCLWFSMERRLGRSSCQTRRPQATRDVFVPELQQVLEQSLLPLFGALLLECGRPSIGKPLCFHFRLKCESATAQRSSIASPSSSRQY